MVLVGICGKFEHAAASLRHVCEHKKESRLIGYIACEDAAGGGSFISQLIKLIILMADCNPERIVFMKHM